jgi:hypothetical protein
MESSNGLGLAGGPLSNGYIYINQAAHLTMRDSIIQNTPVTNAVLIGASVPGSTSFVSIGNQWTPGTGSGMSMANTGFSQWRTAAESGSVQGGFLISCGDSGILDTPGACFQFGEGGSLIGSEGHIVVSSAHPHNTASFNVFTAEPNSTSTGFVNEARGFQTKINGFNNSTSMTWVPFDVTWMSGVRGGNYGGYRSVFPVVAGTTMPSARGFWVKAPASSSAITTAEGYYSEDICGVGGIGTCYAFHSVGANDLVSAAGPGSFKTVTSTVATGTAPLAVTSTTPVANLTVSNHPMLDDCGTTSTCSATQKTAALIVRGSVAFPSATTVTVTSLPFTSSSTYSCTAGDQTNPAGVVNATTYTSGSSVTFTETNGVNTDTIRYICVGF